MLTAFGKELRKLRIEHGEVLRDTASHLGVSASFVSAVESGKKKIPANWIGTLSDVYSLSAEQKNALSKAAQESCADIKINLSEAGPRQRNAALVFARNFDSLSDEAAAQILNLLESGHERSDANE
ncbi:MAG: helix-turn-helix transcriptional regulator [Clostridiales bacterium]|nr:helix-turn-helix transcriptional regulator [Clostridiales bacterium]